jgi:hypothetical protein
MSNNCYYRLTLDVSNAIREDYVFPTPTHDYGIWNPPAEKIFRKEWMEYMQSIGVPLYNAMLFYRAPGASTKETHVDISKTNPLRLTNYGINWCIGGRDSEMVWYRPPKELRDEDVIWTRAKTPYIAMKYDQVTEIERCHVGSEVTLVKTDLPHAVLMGDEPRWCISARTSWLDNYPWDGILELLRSKNLLVER